MLTSVGQQNDSIIRGYTFFFVFFSIMVYHSISNGLSCVRQDLIVYPFSIRSFTSANPKLTLSPTPFPFDNHLSVLHVPDSISAS